MAEESSLSDALIALVTRAGNAAVDIKIAKETGTAYLPTTHASTVPQQQAAGLSAGGQQQLAQYLPMVLAVLLVGAIVWKLKR